MSKGAAKKIESLLDGAEFEASQDAARFIAGLVE